MSSIAPISTATLSAPPAVMQPGDAVAAGGVANGAYTTIGGPFQSAQVGAALAGGDQSPLAPILAALEGVIQQLRGAIGGTQPPVVAPTDPAAGATTGAQVAGAAAGAPQDSVVTAGGPSNSADAPPMPMPTATGGGIMATSIGSAASGPAASGPAAPVTVSVSPPPTAPTTAGAPTVLAEPSALAGANGSAITIGGSGGSGAFAIGFGTTTAADVAPVNIGGLGGFGLGLLEGATGVVGAAPTVANSTIGGAGASGAFAIYSSTGPAPDPAATSSTAVASLGGPVAAAPLAGGAAAAPTATPTVAAPTAGPNGYPAAADAVSAQYRTGTPVKGEAVDTILQYSATTGPAAATELGEWRWIQDSSGAGIYTHVHGALATLDAQQLADIVRTGQAMVHVHYDGSIHLHDL